MAEASNSLILTLVFLGALLSIIAGLWYMKRKYPEETLGEIISVLFQRQTWTIYVFAILTIGLAEAGMAASFHIVGQVESNPIIRFTSHAIIAAVYTAAQFGLPPAIVKLFKSFTEKNYVKSFGHVVQVLGLFLVAFGLPLANLALIASGIAETDKLEIFVYWLRTDAATFHQFLVDGGLPLNYKPFGAMSYVLAVSTVLTGLVHPILGIGDGIFTITQGGERSLSLLNNPKPKEKNLTAEEKKKAKDEVKEKDKEKRDELEEKRKAADDFTGNIEYLLNRLGYDKGKNNTIFTAQRDRIKTVVDKTTDAREKAAYAEMISKFRSQFVELDKSNASKDAIYKLQMEVFNKFQKSPKEGGFGTSLKRPVEPKN